MTPNGDQMAAQFMRGEPLYDRKAWIETYAKVFAICKPGVTREEASAASVVAYSTQGAFNPKIAAGLDALLGPYIAPT